MKTEEEQNAVIARVRAYGAVISESNRTTQIFRTAAWHYASNEGIKSHVPHPSNTVKHRIQDFWCPFEEFGMPDGFTLRVCGWTVGCSAASTPCT